ncbi:MAG: transposase [Nitrospira sp.]
MERGIGWSPSTRSGRPVANACIESFNGRLRDECLNGHPFDSLAEAQAILETWRMDDNRDRPHGSLEHLTPSEFVSQRQDERIAEAIICSGSKLSRNGTNVICQNVLPLAVYD